MRIMAKLPRLLSFCALAAAALGLSTPASAATLTIDSSLSSITLSIDIGSYSDPEDPNTFESLGSAVGQGDVLTIGTGVGEAQPGYSNGLTAQVGGTVTVTPGGFTIDTSSAVPLDSGLWQPGTNPDPSLGTPVAGQYGAYVSIPGLATAWLNLSGLNFAISTSGPVTLDGFGNFTDPSALVTIVTGAINGFLASDIPDVFPSGPLNSAITNESSTLPVAGNYSGGILTLPLSGFLDVEVSPQPTLIVARIGLTGTIVTVVPEPSSIAMACSAMVGVVAYGVYGRRRRR